MLDRICRGFSIYIWCDMQDLHAQSWLLQVALLLCVGEISLYEEVTMQHGRLTSRKRLSSV